MGVARGGSHQSRRRCRRRARVGPACALPFMNLSIGARPMKLSHQVVVITGASAGVGRATARLFARHNTAIGLLARGSEGLEGVRREAEVEGGRALVQATDVADPA